MTEPRTPEAEEEFKVLEALAKIGDVADFRVTGFMREIGMDERQPTLLYRKLIPEAREVMSLINLIEEYATGLENTVSQLKTELSSREQEIKALKAKKDNLEGEARHKMESLESERQAASQLQEMAECYEGVKELLKGQMNTKTVGALYRLADSINMEMLLAEVGGQPPPNLDRLESVKQKLRDDLMEALEIPHNTLEKENARLREQIDAIVGMLKRVYGGEGKAG